MSLKAEARKLCLARRASLDENERQKKSAAITQKVMALPEYHKAQTVMLFLNFRDEVETTALAEATRLNGKKLVLPRCAPQGVLLLKEICDLTCDIEPGVWGIREPKLINVDVDPSDIDLVVVPGAGFDLQGNRLGYGGGYYDRFFTRLPQSTPRVAIAFECQLMSEVPVDMHDAQMTMLITEQAVYDFRRRSV